MWRLAIAGHLCGTVCRRQLREQRHTKPLTLLVSLCFRIVEAPARQGCRQFGNGTLADSCTAKCRDRLSGSVCCLTQRTFRTQGVKHLRRMRHGWGGRARLLQAATWSLHAIWLVAQPDNVPSAGPGSGTKPPLGEPKLRRVVVSRFIMPFEAGLPAPRGGGPHQHRPCC